jgi:hypothetical protein
MSEQGKLKGDRETFLFFLLLGGLLLGSLLLGGLLLGGLLLGGLLLGFFFFFGFLAC